MKKENLEVILENIEDMFNTVCEGHEAIRSEIRVFSRKTDERFDLVDVKFMAVSNKIDDVDHKLSQRIDELTAHIGEVDRKLSKKIDAVGADLSAHRADTEAHHGVYRVKESE